MESPSAWPEDYFTVIAREFEGLKRLGDRAMSQLPPDAFFHAPADGDNSMAVIVKHVSGNMLSRWTEFLTSDGEKPNRDRDMEFVILPQDTREALLARWEEGWSVLLAAVRPLRTEDLSRTVRIRGEPLTVLQAINRQLTHYAYHVGQLVYLAKHLTGAAWSSLSIPRGQSKTFNQKPAPYIPTQNN